MGVSSMSLRCVCLDLAKWGDQVCVHTEPFGYTLDIQPKLFVRLGHGAGSYAVAPVRIYHLQMLHLQLNGGER